MCNKSFESSYEMANLNRLLLQRTSNFSKDIIQTRLVLIIRTVVSIFILFFLIVSSFAQQETKINALSDTSIQMLYAHPKIVIDKGMPGTEGNQYGFEGGRVIKINSTYHLFTSEVMNDPMWVKMKLGYWVSTDRIHWKRKATIRESSGNYDGTDERASYWSPMPVWNKEDNAWHLFYVAYKSEPNDEKSFRNNYDGRIINAISQTKGYEGIAGPYKEMGIVMSPGKDSDSWEGLQGVDSFFPYQIGDKWFAFYGSANTEQLPIKKWAVGLAGSANLHKGWKRMSENNPLRFEHRFIENPIVTEIPGKGWVCVYDTDVENTFGWAYSKDGIVWQRGKPVSIVEKSKGWVKDVRTPLGLVYEGNDTYTVFYTGFKEAPQWDSLQTNKKFNTSGAIGFVEVIIK